MHIFNYTGETITLGDVSLKPQGKWKVERKETALTEKVLGCTVHTFFCKFPYEMAKITTNLVEGDYLFVTKEVKELIDTMYPKQKYRVFYLENGKIMA